ncbi:MAG: uroporphyrinogen-III synthase [Bacteroidales bacterium]|nr:uroporphyrinogen-III synthase [Bacteroidales bacterium]
MKLKKILISQPKPTDIEQSPYRNLVKKYNIELTFFKFFDVVGVTASEFRKSRIHLSDYTAVIFNSKNAVDNYFRLAKELRESISDSMKYFCTSESIANYLQTYIQYRKRKVFFGQQYLSDLLDIMYKHKEENYLFPCSEDKMSDFTKQLDKAKFKYTRAMMYYSQPKDLSQFNLKDFDMIVLFSPNGVKALKQSFPDLKSGDITIGALGSTTHAALTAAGLNLDVAAPTKTSPSMAMAIENYILGKEQGQVIVPKTIAATKSKAIEPSKRSAAATANSTTPVKKTRSVIADKAKYKQLQEERKAQAAARRAERAAAKAAQAAQEAQQKAVAETFAEVK